MSLKKERFEDIKTGTKFQYRHRRYMKCMEPIYEDLVKEPTAFTLTNKRRYVVFKSSTLVTPLKNQNW